MSELLTSPLFRADGLPRDCTFDPQAWAVLARCWHPIACVADVADKPFGAKLLDVPLVVYRAGSALVVADDICPHRGVPLSLGTQVEGGVACAYHGLRFGAEGHCFDVPGHPERSIPEKMRARTYRAVERYGLVWTCLTPETGQQPSICEMPHWDDEGFQQVVLPFTDFAASAGRQLEGFIDV